MKRAVERSEIPQTEASTERAPTYWKARVRPFAGGRAAQRALRTHLRSYPRRRPRRGKPICCASWKVTWMTPMGQTREIKVNVAVVLATNRDLDQAVRDGALRADFHDRFRTLAIQLLPLRERPW